MKKSLKYSPCAWSYFKAFALCAWVGMRIAKQMNAAAQPLNSFLQTHANIIHSSSPIYSPHWHCSGNADAWCFFSGLEEMSVYQFLSFPFYFPFLLFSLHFLSWVRFFLLFPFTSVSFLFLIFHFLLEFHFFPFISFFFLTFPFQFFPSIHSFVYFFLPCVSLFLLFNFFHLFFLFLLFPFHFLPSLLI